MSYYNMPGSSDTGSTLTAAIIIVIFIAIAGIGIARCSTGASGEDHEAAEKGAREFAQQMGLKATGVSCAKTDSDGDGYVSCTLALSQPDGTTKLEAIECARVVTFNQGCRMQKPGMVRGR